MVHLPSRGQVPLTLLSENVALAEWFNSSNENGTDKDDAGR